MSNSKIDDTMWNTVWTTVAIWDGLERPHGKDTTGKVYFGTCGGYYHFNLNDVKQFDKIHGTHYYDDFVKYNDNDEVK